MKRLERHGDEEAWCHRRIKRDRLECRVPAGATKAAGCLKLAREIESMLEKGTSL